MYELIEIPETTDHARKRIMRRVNRQAKQRGWEIRSIRTGETVGVTTDSELVFLLRKVRELYQAMKV